MKYDEGKTYPVEYKRHEPGHNHYYIKMQPEFLEQGIARKVMFGAGTSYIVDAVAETEYMLKRLKEQPELFMHEYNF